MFSRALNEPILSPQIAKTILLLSIRAAHCQTHFSERRDANYLNFCIALIFSSTIDMTDIESNETL